MATRLTDKQREALRKKVLARKRTFTVAEIVEVTGLSRPTVSRELAKMLVEGLVTNGKGRGVSSKPGRRPMWWSAAKP